MSECARGAFGNFWSCIEHYRKDCSNDNQALCVIRSLKRPPEERTNEAYPDQTMFWDFVGMPE